jgi:teichuronic acid biosynthesis glycosyltransferase TuaG
MHSAEVSIVMPLFNSERFLEMAVFSVIQQTFSEWELIICDDASSDNSLKIAKALAKTDSRIIVLENGRNRGASISRNRCLSVAKGRYIAFLDSDDLWFPQKLEKQVSFMKKVGAAFVFGYCDNISERGEWISATMAPRRVSLKKLCFCNFLPCLTVIYDTEVLGKVEQPKIKKRNDFALWLKILKENNGLEARCLPEILAVYRVNRYGLSASKVAGIKYFYICLRRFGDLGIFSAGLSTTVAVLLKGVKTIWPAFYNQLVTRLL